MLPNIRRGFVIAGLSLAAIAGQNAARAEEPSLDYMGRWVIDDPTDKFSENGRLYRIVDIAPCGNDFCGVSVGEQSSCGSTLFRFLTAHAHDEVLSGHGKWGSAKKKLEISGSTDDKKATVIALGIGGDDYSIMAREGSMPTFEASYHRIGEAACKADGIS